MKSSTSPKSVVRDGITYNVGDTVKFSPSGNIYTILELTKGSAFLKSIREGRGTNGWHPIIGYFEPIKLVEEKQEMKSITSNGVTFRLGDTIRSITTGNLYQIGDISGFNFGLDRHGKRWGSMPINTYTKLTSKKINQFQLIKSDKQAEEEEIQSITSNGVTFHIGDTVRSLSSGYTYKIKNLTGLGKNRIKIKSENKNGGSQALLVYEDGHKKGTNVFVIIKSAKQAEEKEMTKYPSEFSKMVAFGPPDIDAFLGKTKAAKFRQQVCPQIPCNIRQPVANPMRARPTHLCVRCQANPLRRDCECLGFLTERAVKKSNVRIMISRRGWDNIKVGNNYGYLHMNSDTKIIDDGIRFQWTSKRNPESGRATVLYSKIGAISPLELMLKAEALMERSGHAWDSI